MTDTERRYCTLDGQCSLAPCCKMQSIAAQTWEFLSIAQTLSLGYNEETITETALITLTSQFPGYFVSLPFSKIAEGKSGADWDWFVRNGSGGWWRLRVQAKRLHVKDYFRGLFTQKAGSSGNTQIDTLIASAAAETRKNPAFPQIPVYCFYIRKPQLGSSWWQGPAAVTGCTLAHAETVRQVGSHKLADIAHITFPWHLLCCACPVGDGEDGGGLPDLVRQLHRARVPGSDKLPSFRASKNLPGFIEKWYFDAIATPPSERQHVIEFARRYAWEHYSRDENPPAGVTVLDPFGRDHEEYLSKLG